MVWLFFRSFVIGLFLFVGFFFVVVCAPWWIECELGG